jgi:hypothetical protein
LRLSSEIVVKILVLESDSVVDPNSFFSDSDSDS